MSAQATLQEASASTPQESTPRWVERRVIGSIPETVEHVYTLRAGAARGAAVLFTKDRVLLAEKPTMGRPKVYELYFPENFAPTRTECPNCHASIDVSFRRVHMGPRTEPGPAPEPTEPKPQRRPFKGKQAYPILDVEGIGETYARRLEKNGISTTHDLLEADPTEVARVSQASPSTVVNWYSMADLMRVQDVGKQFAELLARAGVSSVQQLGEEQPKPLLQRLKDLEAGLDVRIQGAPLTLRRVKGWIAGAKGLA